MRLVVDRRERVGVDSQRDNRTLPGREPKLQSNLKYVLGNGITLDYQGTDSAADRVPV
jgi:hypothetical protein